MTMVAGLWVFLAAGGGEPAVYALIIGNNHSFDGSEPPLRFADDDAARYHELFALSGGHSELYTVLDADTQRLFPELVERSRPPRRSEIIAGVNRLFAQARADAQAGRKVVFYFVFSGHGDVKGQEGYVHLLDGPWTRSDLFAQVLAPSPATFNHVVIDACHAYYMVAGRGGQARPTGDFAMLVRDFVGNERLAAFPNTGVMLSTSRAAEVHEWGRIEAGLFSHALRSAIAGAGDSDQNGTVDYDEAAAFVAAANGSLPDRKVRIEVFARAPAQKLDEPLAQVPAGGVRVEVPATWEGRYYFEDDRGVRFADFHKTAEVALAMHLVPRGRYYLRSSQDEIVLDPATQGDLQVAALASTPLSVSTRGSTNDAFERYLFAIPFGPRFVVGFKQARLTALTPVEVVESSALVPWRYAAASAAGVAAVTAVVLEVMAQSAAREYRNSAGSEAELSGVRGRAESLHGFALVTGGVALGAAATAGVLYWLDHE